MKLRTFWEKNTPFGQLFTRCPKSVLAKGHLRHKFLRRKGTVLALSDKHRSLYLPRKVMEAFHRL